MTNINHILKRHENPARILKIYKAIIDPSRGISRAEHSLLGTRGKQQEMTSNPRNNNHVHGKHSMGAIEIGKQKYSATVRGDINEGLQGLHSKNKGINDHKEMDHETENFLVRVKRSNVNKEGSTSKSKHVEKRPTNSASPNGNGQPPSTFNMKNRGINNHKGMDHEMENSLVRAKRSIVNKEGSTTKRKNAENQSTNFASPNGNGQPPSTFNMKNRDMNDHGEMDQEVENPPVRARRSNVNKEASTSKSKHAKKRSATFSSSNGNEQRSSTFSLINQGNNDHEEMNEELENPLTIGDGPNIDSHVQNDLDVDNEIRIEAEVPTQPQKKQRVIHYPLARTTPKPAVLEPPPVSPGNGFRNPTVRSGESTQGSRCGSTSNVGNRSASRLNLDDLDEVNGTNDEEAVKKGRGPAKDNANLPPHGRRWVVEWNMDGQAVGETSTYLNNRIAVIAIKGHIWHVDRKWNKMEWPFFQDTWELLVVHYDFNDHPNRWDYCFDVLHRALRVWKYELREHYDKYGEKNIPERVMPDQWMNLVEYWNTDQFKKISAQNKLNKAGCVMNPRFGSMTHAQWLEDQFHEQNNRPSFFDAFCEANKPKPNRPHTKAANRKLTGMKNFVEAKKTQALKSGAPVNLPEIEREAMVRFLGPQKSDRIRGAGVGVMKPHRMRAANFAPQRLQIADRNINILTKENIMLKERLKKHESLFKEISSRMGIPLPFDLYEDDQERGASERASASKRPPFRC